VSANPAEWDYDEASLSLAKPLFDAEIRLGREILTDAPLSALPPVPVRARVGTLSTEFQIVRRHVRSEYGPRQETMDHIWCCIDYNLLHFRDEHTGLDIPTAELAPERWAAVDRVFTEGLVAFSYLALRTAILKLFHFIGRRTGTTWHPLHFRSFGGNFPKSWELAKLQTRYTAEDVPAPAEGWRFEPLPSPRMVNADGESLTHEGLNSPDLNADGLPHHFVYQGKFGEYRIPVAFRFVTGIEPRPRVWLVDCRTPFDISSGHPRFRGHPARPGTARLSASEWAQFEETLTNAFLQWPRTLATGYRPLWIQFDHGYHEGVWGMRLFLVGLDNAVTGLPDLSG
jgi:hypothetical protein